MIERTRRRERERFRFFAVTIKGKSESITSSTFIYSSLTLLPSTLSPLLSVTAARAGVRIQGWIWMPAYAGMTGDVGDPVTSI